MVEVASDISQANAERNYTVRTRINRPIADVFKAIVDREIITRYFVDATSHSMVEGQKVAWTWECASRYAMDLHSR